MIRLYIYSYLLFNICVYAPPPSLIQNHHRSPANLTNSNRQTSSSKLKFVSHKFDIQSYRSSWKFIDKNTIRIRFRLSEIFYQSNFSPRFLVRHLHSGEIRTYNEVHESINSTLTIYLHHLKHGRHIVCLLLYRTKLMLKPQHIFCQDFVNNFHKYGRQDMETEEYGNTFVFLLTQYSIVIGLLCTLQLVHTIRKRRFWNIVHGKVNSLRNFRMDNSSVRAQEHSQSLNYLIYNFNRNALYNFDNVCHQKEHDENHSQYLRIPDLRRRHTILSDEDEETFIQNSSDEQSLSYQSVSHILEENKPWIAKFNENNTVQHEVYSNNDRLHFHL